ncbi:MAG: SHOCT domain-containing protein [Spirochaetes bacterium]|nr:SHOCT domain-containing protein [Spirochaetota bacterium]
MEAILIIALFIAAFFLWRRFWNKPRDHFLQNNPEFRDATEYSLVPGNAVFIRDDGIIALKNRSMADFAVVHVSDIVDFDIKKNGQFHGSVAGSIGGALLFGAVGMVIGTIAAGKEKVHELSVVFVVNHAQYQRIEIDFLNSRMKAGGVMDRLLSAMLERMVSQLQVLESNHNRRVAGDAGIQQGNVPPGIDKNEAAADQIRKLHELMVSGAITAEEFDTMKKKIIGSP